jgi:phosphotransferase system, enzyme I, PtsP
MASNAPSQVHGESARTLALTDFIEFTSRPLPLGRLLDEAPARIAAILQADVCSIYLREGSGKTLVMRGNVGFKKTALGRVELTVGEGITGKAVATAKPVTVADARKSASYKHIDDLGEEAFPVFLAAPILGRGGVLGAVVTQRKAIAFTPADVDLALAVGAIIAAGVRTAELLDERRERPTRKAGGGTRRVTLTGLPLVTGRAIGAAAALRRPAARPSVRPPGEGVTPEDAQRAECTRLAGAFEEAERGLSQLHARSAELKLGKKAAFLWTFDQILSDQRFRERALELVEGGAQVGPALATVAREVARTATAFSRDAFMEDRARDIEDLCDAISMLAAADKRAELPQRAVLLGDSLTVFDLLVSARCHPGGIALSPRAVGARTQALVDLLGVPVLAGVDGLFRWASDGDIVLVDADHGFLHVNPSKSEVAQMREYKRRHEAAVDKSNANTNATTQGSEHAAGPTKDDIDDQA